MTTDLEPVNLTRKELDVIRDQLAPGASDAELAFFSYVSTQLGLHPFRGQIVLIGRWDKRVGRDVFRPQITVDGRRAIASRNGLVGIEGPQWCAARKHEEDELDWLDVWDREGLPYAARVFVYREGWTRPANGTVKWSEFKQTGPLWDRMPAHMLGKVAESLALRRAFPEAIGTALVAVAYDAQDEEADEPPELVRHGDGATGPQEASIARPPAAHSAPTQYIVPTTQQESEIRVLFDQLGLIGDEYRDARLGLVAEATGREVLSTKELTRDDCARLITFLREFAQDEADMKEQTGRGDEDHG